MAPFIAATNLATAWSSSTAFGRFGGRIFSFEPVALVVSLDIEHPAQNAACRTLLLAGRTFSPDAHSLCWPPDRLRGELAGDARFATTAVFGPRRGSRGSERGQREGSESKGFVAVSFRHPFKTQGRLRERPLAWTGEASGTRASRQPGDGSQATPPCPSWCRP